MQHALDDVAVLVDQLSDLDDVRVLLVEVTVLQPVVPAQEPTRVDVPTREVAHTADLGGNDGRVRGPAPQSVACSKLIGRRRSNESVAQSEVRHRELLVLIEVRTAAVHSDAGDGAVR